nr:glutaredoxin family protein [Ottowia thiooxydans]
MPANSLVAVFAALLLGSAAHAQLYRSVGSDGRVTYSDKPPAVSTNNRAPGGSAGGTTGATPAGDSAASGDTGLPFQFRQTVQRFPVTLYTTGDCAPCSSGRSFLITRGVPFTEKTVTTKDDIAALRRLTGTDNSIPQLTIGGQHLKGFSDADWAQYLDAAGYPKTAQLPSSYRRPVASPLVPVQVRPVGTQPAADSGAEQAQTDPEVAPPPSDSNPAGIRF